MQPDKTILANWFIVLCLLVTLGTIRGQEKNVSGAAVSLNVKSMPLDQVLSLIEKQTLYKFAYSSDFHLEQKKVTLLVQNMPVSRLLAILFKNKGIQYTIMDNQIILEKVPLPKIITISGYVKDSTSGESLHGAIIYVPALNKTTSTNEYGFYSLSARETARLTLNVSYKGYQKKTVPVNASHNTIKNLNLVANIRKPQPDSIIIQPQSEARSEAEKLTDSLGTDSANNTPQQLEQSLTNDSTGNNSDELAPINDWAFTDMSETVSSVSGNGDIMHSIQMMPGVMAGLDASTGYFVRGGNADQNLVQLDEAILYNPSHFFGFISILNTSALNSGTLFKDGYPASYGGNLSSVLDISMKEGNNQHTGGDIQLGTTTSGFTFYGPIVKQKSSYLLAARRSVMDLWLRALQTENNYNNYYFYDVNAKINYQLSQNDRIYVSLYHGRDKSSYSRDSVDSGPIDYGIEYGNQALTLRWNHLFSQKIFSNTSIVYNNYFQSITALQKPYYAQLYSGIRDNNLKTDLNYYPNLNHKISGGISYLFQTLMPASVSDTELSAGSIITVNPSNIPEKHSWRLAAYLDDEIKLSRRLLMYAGVRVPLFSSSNVNYINIEPRLSVLYASSPTSGIKFTYTQMHQYLHQVRSYNASFPAEIWIGSSKTVKPGASRQASAGIYKNFRNNMLQTSMEFYYKEMYHQLLFKGGEQPTITSDIENSLIFGEGQSYGMELLLRKAKGKLTGQLAYTLSYASQQFDSLNLGDPFPFANDRRHCLYATAMYAINQHWNISSSLVITSGRAFTVKSKSSTFPGQGKGLYDNEKVAGKNKNLIEQNNYRLAPYNRLDFSITYNNKKQLKQRILESEWIFSVYNVYARPNTFFAYRSIDPVSNLPEVQQVSFLSVIPSITYRLVF
jgi:hypothetical protein